MAAFPSRDRDAFMTHWVKILGDESVAKKTILCGEQPAGYIVCFERSAERVSGPAIRSSETAEA